MGKTRAEIQKAYRERKKRNDPEFLKKEKQRQSTYRVPAAGKSTKKLKEYHERNKIYCATYRLNQKIKQLEDSRSRADEVEAQPSRASNSSSSSTTNYTVNEHTTRSAGERLLVQLPFKIRSPVTSKRRSKALRKARYEIKALQNKLRSKERSTKKWQKRCERMQTGKNQQETQAQLSERDQATTPKSKTLRELRNDGISPRTLPRSVVRKLVLSNCVLAEIKNAREENRAQKHQRVINTIIVGKITKKYKCGKYLHKAIGIGRIRSGLERSKVLNYTTRKRQASLKAQLTNHVITYFERDEVSRCMPGKNDAVNVGGEKRQTRILNDYLSNLYERFRSEEPTVKLSFSTFCKMRPKNIKVTSLLSRNTCLCTRHQNMALKLKCLRSLGIDISPNPEVIKKTVPQGDMETLLGSITASDVEYEEWRRVQMPDGKKKMRILKISKDTPTFNQFMAREYQLFLEHVGRVSTDGPEEKSSPGSCNCANGLC